MSKTSTQKEFQLFRRYILTPMDAINMAVIFEDLSDQMAIIASNINSPYLEVRSKRSLMDNKQINKLNPSDQDLFYAASISLQPHYDTVIPRRIMEMRNGPREESLRPCSSSTVIERAIKASKISEPFMRQRDLHFIQSAAYNVIQDLVQTCSYTSLKEAFDKEKCKKQMLLKKFNMPKELNAKIIKLKNQLSTLKADQEKESRRLNSIIYHYKNEIQEVRERTQMEIKFMENTANMKISKSRKYWIRQDKQCEQTRSFISEEIEREKNRNNAMVEIIHSKTEAARETLSYWIDKYDMDKDILVAELEMLKDARQRGLYRMEELNILTNQYKPIVEDNRRIKHIKQARLDTLANKNKRATRIQAWWRGTMVRRQLGRFHPSVLPDSRPVMSIPRIDLSSLSKAPTPSRFSMGAKSMASFTKSFMEVNKKFKKSEITLKPSEVFLNLRQNSEQELRKGAAAAADEKKEPTLDEIQEESSLRADSEAGADELGDELRENVSVTKALKDIMLSKSVSLMDAMSKARSGDDAKPQSAPKSPHFELTK